MTTSTKLGIPYLAQQQATPEIVHNEALYMIEIMLRGVIDRTDTPPGSPTDGDTYLITAGATGAWAGWDNHLTIYASNAWRFVPGYDSDGAPIAIGAAQEGLRVYVNDENAIYVWSGSAWAQQTIAASSVSFTPSGNLSATDVQAALVELDTEKVAKAGDSMTGGLTITTSSGNSLTINTSGTLGVSIITTAGAGLQVAADGVTGTNSLRRFQNSTGAPSLNFDKARGSQSVPAVVAFGDLLGSSLYRGHDGTTFQQGATIQVQAIAATPSSTNMRARLVFSVSPDASVTPATALALDSDGIKAFGTATANIVIDAERIFRPRSYTVATLPTITTTGIIHCSDLGGGGALLYSDGTGWCRVKPRGTVTIATDAGHTFTWSRLSSAPTTRGNATLTADRTATLDTAGCRNGDVARFIRLGAGAFNWNIAGGTTKALGAANTWCEFEFDGTTWNLVASGTL